MMAGGASERAGFGRAALGGASEPRFPMPASALAHTQSPLLAAMGVRPSTLKSPGLKYPLPLTGRSPSTPTRGGGPAGFAVGGGAVPGSPIVAAAGAGGADGMRPSPASRTAGHMLLASPARP